MAQNDEATLVIGGGKFYTAVVGTEAPEDISEPGSAWKEIGHTSLENIFAINSEGGDVTILGTLQSRELRTKRAPRSESFRINLAQWDEDALQFYFGSNAVTEDGWMEVPSDPTPVKVAFLAAFTDSGRQFGIYSASTEMARGDNIDLSDTENLATLPVDIKPLQYQGADSAWSLTPLGQVTGGIE